jgi:hypothetical protein
MLNGKGVDKYDTLEEKLIGLLDRKLDKHIAV